LNLDGLSSVNSQGLSVLINAQKRAKEKDGDLRLSSLRPSIRELFELTRLQTVFQIFDTDDDAIKSF